MHFSFPFHLQMASLPLLLSPFLHPISFLSCSLSPIHSLTHTFPFSTLTLPLPFSLSPLPFSLSLSLSDPFSLYTHTLGLSFTLFSLFLSLFSSMQIFLQNLSQSSPPPSFVLQSAAGPLSTKPRMRPWTYSISHWENDLGCKYVYTL